MDKGITNLQRSKYETLLKERLPELIAGASCTMEDGLYSLKCSMFPVNTSLIHTRDNTNYYPVRAICDLTNCSSGESVSFNLDLIHVPVFYELGFRIRNNYMQMLDKYERAPGWYFTYNQKKNSKYPEIAAKALGTYGRTFTFIFDNRLCSYVAFKNAKTQRDSMKAGAFFRALTGMGNSELLSIFGSSNPYVAAAFSDNYGTNDDLVMELARIMFPPDRVKALGTVAMAAREIKQSIYSQAYLDMGDGNTKRFGASVSYKRRAVNRLFAEDITLLGKKYPRGSVITTELARLLDASPVNSLKVTFNDKVYDLKKFTHFNFQGLGAILAEDVPECGLETGQQLDLASLKQVDGTKRTSLSVKWEKNYSPVVITRRLSAASLSQEDLFTAFSIFMDNVNGYEVYDKPFELSNRVCVTFDDEIYNQVSSRLASVIKSLEKLVKRNGTDQSLLLALSELKLGGNNNLLLSEAQDTFIDEIRNASVKEGQMSDMCNILAFASKSNKVAADVDENQATPDMRNVQDTQQGRLDPFDAPESSKIGLVHHKTLLADTDGSGMLTAPYLEVRNGVASKEPVMLTANDEMGKNIAAWNETFREADGSLKKAVTVRCDNTPAIVPAEKVHYKEYSPLQDMSAAHAMVTLANHSNGKRITMACNQAAQAIPTVNNPDRPLLGTGCESIVDLGNYKASDVLDSYFGNLVLTRPELERFEERIKRSAIRLDSIAKINDSRDLVFTVMEAAAITKETGIAFSITETLTIPYNLRNFNDVLFSFRLNHKEDRVYKPDDIVAYSNCYSVEERERVDLLDFGSMPVDESCFKGGLALGRNLLCGYKTCGSSTIEDALTISDSLVYDETLTHVRVIQKKAVAADSKIYHKEFGVAGNGYPYFDESGLPKAGSILKAGDPFVSILRTGKRDSAVSAEYRYLKAYEGGQVVKAEIIRKNGEAEAQVTFAKRNPIENGDKMAGRHGNKGVIARILPKEQMPYDPETGRTLDILLNPLGVPSRQNISQLLEAAIAMCRYVDGKSTNISPYHPDDVKFIKEQTEQFNVHPIELVDGRTGQRFKRPINVGVIYMSKLHHVAESKMHSIGTDAPADPVFLQPKKGSKNEGGQSFGEMENWALHGVGANKVLKDLYGLQSDDIVTRDNFQKHLLGRAQLTVDGDEDNANYNDTAFLAFIRSLGSELCSNQEENCYELKPLTDNIIKSFSAVPVESADGLHSTAIFGKDNTNQKRGKVLNKKKWGWIDLGTKIVHPTWIKNGTFSKCICINIGGKTKGFGHVVAEDIIEGRLYVRRLDDGSWEGFPLPDSTSAGTASLKEVFGLSDDCLMELETGMKAVVHIIESINIQDCVNQARRRLSYAAEKGYTTSSKKYLELAENLAMFESFADSGNKPSDYVITSFPVMPQTFRVRTDSARFVNSTPDFDYYYAQIITAATQCKNLDSCENEANLYKRISEFIGYQEAGNSKYRHLLGYFTGKNNSSHGKIRSALQSKRIVCAGRAVIHPARESIKPTELGVPIAMLVKMAQVQLTGYFIQKAQSADAGLIAQNRWKELFTQLAVNDFDKFADVYLEGDSGFFTGFGMKTSEAFKQMRGWITEYFEQDRDDRPVVLMGRQPTLHKYSIRAFYPVVLETKAIELCALLCKGFNADFDGDQTWVSLVLSDEARNEALEKLSPAVDFINPKNSSIMLSHSQDIVLGCYAATMLKDNETIYSQGIRDAHYYSSIEVLKADVSAGLLELYDLVCFNASAGNAPACYLSTAGRILFNSIFEDGFTTEPYTNPLNIAGIRTERFYNLKYDGIITSGNSGSNPVQYYSLSDICMDRYLFMGRNCIDEYDALLKFGFYYSDLTGVSVSFEDLDVDSNKEQLLKEAEVKKTQLEQDFQDGLVSIDDKKEAIVSLYNDEENGVLPKIMENLLNNLGRNNNIFIMMDSGARGNKTQAMHMCGAIGILGKTKSENMEDAVTSNYYEGLSSLEVQMTSYSSRVGVAATQMETRNAGYSTRKVVYMTDGVSITANDCGKEDWWFDVVWDDINPGLTKFYPSPGWYSRNLEGLSLVLLDGRKSGRLCDKSLCDELMEKGFHELVAEKDGKTITIVAGLELIRDAKIAKDDVVNQKLFKYLLEDGRIGMDALIAFDHYKTKEINTTAGRLSCRYKMSARCRSELLYREARNLAFLGTCITWHGVTVDRLEYVTEKTLDWIEEQGLDIIEARVMLDCECAHGVCAHCYGLKFSNLQIPDVGDVVGTESAQSIGEPASQLTLDVINKGGVAGASVASGIDIFSAYLNGSVYNKDVAVTAAIPERSGYARITKLDNSVSIAVEPEDKECGMCSRCILANEKKSGRGCPLHDKKPGTDPVCAVPDKIPISDVLVKNGEWVKSGNPVTAYTPVSDSVVSVDDSDDPGLLLRKKQVIWIDNYYNVFSSQSVNINAKHFELLAMVQNGSAVVTESDNSKYRAGHTYPVSELRVAVKEGSNIGYALHTTNLRKTILNNSGLLTSLTFSHQPDTLQNATFRGLKSSCEYNTSPIGKITVGQDIGTKTVKELPNTSIRLSDVQAADTTREEDGQFIPLSVPGGIDLDLTSSMDSFGLNVFDGLFDLPDGEETVSLEEMPGEETSIAEEEMPEEENITVTVKYRFDGVVDETMTEEVTAAPGSILTPAPELLEAYKFIENEEICVVSVQGEVLVFDFESISGRDAGPAPRELENTIEMSVF